jgi:hypothetical protein
MFDIALGAVQIFLAALSNDHDMFTISGLRAFSKLWESQTFVNHFFKLLFLFYIALVYYQSMFLASSCSSSLAFS